MTTHALSQSIKACDFWAGLEYLNVVAVPDADEKKVFHVESDPGLPWLHLEKRRRLRDRGKKYYTAQIAYGGLFSKATFTAHLRSLLGAEAISARELPTGTAAALLVPLDNTGRVCGEPFISSLPWFMGRLLARMTTGRPGNEVDLAGFEAFHKELSSDVRQLLVQLQLVPEEDNVYHDMQRQRQEDAASARLNDGQVRGDPAMRPLALDDVSQLLSLIWKRCGWAAPGPGPNGARSDEAVRIKLVTMTRHLTRSVDLGAMNSMVAADVMKVRGQLANGADIGPALRQYLKLAAPPSRIDLRDATVCGGLGLFIDSLKPGKLPIGAWPDFPLVASQQFAVNMSRQHLVEGGLYGVNGPPGTGKSTLLRDIIADLLIGRAEAMVTFKDPLDAFASQGTIEGHPHRFWKVDPKLCGHGIVVASSNNGAVENVIHDLPKATAATREAAFKYFNDVSDSLAASPKARQRHGGATWGLVAALLGSAEKRRAFIDRFWYEPLSRKDETPDPQRLRSLRGIIDGRQHAAVEWTQASAAFKAARQKMLMRAAALQSLADSLQEAATLTALIRRTTTALTDARSACSLTDRQEIALAIEVDDIQKRLLACRTFLAAEDALSLAEQCLLQASAAVAAHPSLQDAQAQERNATQSFVAAERRTTLMLAAKPGFFESLFDWGARRTWRAQFMQAGGEEHHAHERLQASRVLTSHAAEASNALAEAKTAHSHCVAQSNRMASEAAALDLHEPLDVEREQRLAGELAIRRKRLELISAQAKLAREDVRSNEIGLVTQQSEFEAAKRRLTELEAELGLTTQEFKDSCDLARLSDQELQLSVPYQDDTLRRLRVEALRLAMQLNESFVVAAWRRLSGTLSSFVDYQCGKFSLSTEQGHDAAVHLWNAFFLVVPVVSSTFASFDKLFSGLGREDIGTLLIDEAGQSTPQNAVGAIWRSRRVLAVGDPLQLEPIVVQPKEVVSAWQAWVGADKSWTPPQCSTQVLADATTPFGTFVDVGSVKDRKVWVGSPLRVHRRCSSPMFDAANEIAYANLMVHGVHDDTANTDWIGPSQWFDVRGINEEHWVPAQGDFALDLVRKLLRTERLRDALKDEQGKWHINVVTPYKDVAHEFASLLRTAFDDVDDIAKMTGTVHTFQGKEADIVILLLGGNPAKPGAVSFFAGNEQSPNLLNVALTRAKKRLYVIGDTALWTTNSATFRRLNSILEAHMMAPSPSKDRLPQTDGHAEETGLGAVSSMTH